MDPNGTIFCNDLLWDWDHLWYSDYPVFTDCFEDTVLTWIPAAFIWCSLPNTLRKSKSLKGSIQHSSVLLLVKYICSLVLVFIYGFCALSNFWNTSNIVSSVLSDAIKCIDFVCVIIIVAKIHHRKCELSWIFDWYWMLYILCSIPRCFKVFFVVFGSNHPANVKNILEVAATFAVLTQLVALFIIDIRGRDKKRKVLDGNQTFCSKLLISWMTEIVLTGFKRFITLDDLYKLPRELESEGCLQRWRKVWKGETKKTVFSIYKAIIKSHWKSILLVVTLEHMTVPLKLAPAYLLSRVIEHMSSDEPQWKGFLYVFLIFLAIVLHIIISYRSECVKSLIALKMRTSLMNCIYQKLLICTEGINKTHTTGQLVNLLSSDCMSIQYVVIFSLSASAIPASTISVLIMLWQYTGKASLAGSAVLVFVIISVTFYLPKLRALSEDHKKIKDSRMKSIYEILSNVKLLKLHAWEQSFLERVERLRQKEVAKLKTSSYGKVVFSSIIMTASMFSGIACIVAYVLLSNDQEHFPTVVFVTITLFGNFRSIMFVLPVLVWLITENNVVIRRIQLFLQSKETADYRKDVLQPDNAVEMEKFSASWNSGDQKMLIDITMSFQRGQVVAIVGQVGSGKSCFLSALLGEIEALEGEVRLKGSIAYVPQEPWIMNATVKQNIIFNGVYDEVLFNKVLELSCLKEDVAKFPNGDLTEIGERGINISGGQKQRLCLARALYHKSDIYLLDDILSSVDSVVGVTIFQEVIGKEGCLKDKLRILVTNNLSVLPEVDRIIVMKNGSVSEDGTYEELMDNEGYLSYMVKQYILSHGNKTQEKELEVSEEYRTNEKSARYQLIKEENMEKGTVSLKVYALFGKNIGYLGVILIPIVFCAARALDLWGGIWLKDWSNDEEDTADSRNNRLMVYVLISLGHAAAVLLSGLLLYRIALNASTKLHNDALFSVLKAPMSFFESTPSGRLLNRFGQDMNRLDIVFPDKTKWFLHSATNILGMMVLISIVFPVFLSIAIPVLIFYGFFRQAIFRTSRTFQRMSMVSLSPVLNHCAESFKGKTSIRGFALQSAFTNELCNRVDGLIRCEFHKMFCNIWMKLRLELINSFLVLVAGFLSVLHRDSIGPGEAGLLISYALTSSYVFLDFVEKSVEVEESILAAERVSELFALETEGQWHSNDPKYSKNWISSGEVVYNNYSARYRENLDPVLMDINIHIRPGEKVGIVGRTGAGKSSLVLSIFRIINGISGEITIDETGIVQVGLQDLRKRITVISQDPVLFNGTLRLNLDPNNEYQDSELWRSLEMANLKDVFSDGLESDILEAGSNLSVGQRQLVCLSRALLRKSKVLLLDEATSSVDLETDTIIQEAIRRDFADSTIIAIAHRLHTVVGCDKIFVMSNGRIVEEGTPKDLIADSSSVFHTLAKESGLVKDT